MKSAQYYKGFTLIELIVVIAIVGVLAAGLIALINPITQLQKSRDAQRKSDIKQIQAALEFYRAQNGYYPTTLPACGGAWVVSGVTYMQKIPCDPQGGSYKYTTSNPCGVTVGAGMSQYVVRACMEYNNTTDSDRDPTNQPGGLTTWTSPSCSITSCGTKYSYTYTNP